MHFSLAVYDLRLSPADFWDLQPNEFKLLYDRHTEVLESPTRKEMEIARLTAYMVVSSLTEVKSVYDFARFDWDPKPKEKTLEEIREMASTAKQVFKD